MGFEFRCGLPGSSCISFSHQLRLIPTLLLTLAYNQSCSRGEFNHSYPPHVRDSARHTVRLGDCIFLGVGPYNAHSLVSPDSIARLEFYDVRDAHIHTPRVRRRYRRACSTACHLAPICSCSSRAITIASCSATCCTSNSVNSC